MVKESVAKITKVYSTSGELSLRLYDTFNEEYLDEEPLYVEIDALEVPVYVAEFTKRGSDKAIVRLDDIDSEIRALEFVGKELYLYFDVEQEVDLSYAEMIGYRVCDIRSGKSGVVSAFVDYSNNPLFEVDFDGVEVMIPLHENIITAIDEQHKSMTVNLPEGLMDLYEEKV